jgi:serine phosphatase RsbU (regulator of sigma subunit)
MYGTVDEALQAMGFVATSVPSDIATGATGDWHDLIALPNGDMALVVGDAVGMGRDAAPLKEALQSTVRQRALAGETPAAIVAHLRRVVGHLQDAFATIVYAVVKPLGGEVAMINAGHPPPLLVTRDGSVSFLADPPMPLLGAPCTATEPPLGRARLRPGDTMVLYTDGLIESPGAALDEGMERLASIAGRCAQAPLDQLCNGLVTLGLEGSRVDDLTAVALRFSEPRNRAVLAAA